MLPLVACTRNEESADMVRIAAIGDLHVRFDDADRFAPAFERMNDEADLLLLAGDLVELGQVRELGPLLRQLDRCRLPKIAVLGNHDYYSGEVPLLTARLTDAGVRVLEHEVAPFGDLDIVGFKGTAGGFGRMLAPIAEPEIVAFAQLSRLDAERFETTLSQATARHKIVLMHYAPILETIRGEAPEEYVFLGSSRYAEAIDRHRPDLVIHGHAHFGQLSGRTPGGVPVFNVATQISRPDGRIYSLFEVALDEGPMPLRP